MPALELELELELIQSHMAQKPMLRGEVAGAQCNLGVIYDNGRGVKQGPAEAVRWFRKAAEYKDMPALSVTSMSCMIAVEG